MLHRSFVSFLCTIKTSEPFVVLHYNATATVAMYEICLCKTI